MPTDLLLDTEIIRPNHDLNAHMMGRKDKLDFLIKFINDNAALSKVQVILLQCLYPSGSVVDRCPNPAASAFLQTQKNSTLLTKSG